jgi:uncharacterized repeat protein (TIGR01451 family)
MVLLRSSTERTRTTLVVALLGIAAVAALVPSASAAGRATPLATTCSTTGQADLATTLSASGIATFGGYMGYTITVTNNGPDSACNVVMTDHTPSSSSYHPTTFYCVGSVPRAGSGAGWCGLLPPNVTCTTPNVGSPGSVTCTTGLSSRSSMTVVMAIQVGFYFHNQAICDTATASANTVDPNTANNTASVCNRVN